MSIELSFKEFHDKHPEVYERFKKIAIDAITRGKTRISAKFICELMRWNNQIPAASGGIAFNNSYTSRYARLFRAEFPMHADIFETRSLSTVSMMESV